jgi:putative transposase
MQERKSRDLPVIGDGNLERLSDETFDQLRKRLEVGQALKSKHGRTREDVEDASAEIGVHPSTIYRDLSRLEGRGTVRDLAPRKRGYPKGQSRLSEEQEVIISKLIAEQFLNRNRISVAELTARIGWACEDAGVPAPGRAAVIRRIGRIPKRTAVQAREGEKAAHKYTARPGSFRVQAPWDVWQIDHTLIDVIVVDRAHRRPIGRAWLTVVVDVATRVVCSFYVGLEPPSSIRAATAMELAVRRKDQWLEWTGIAGVYQWPISGLPKIVHSDRAVEFRSRVFSRALNNQGVATFLRPAGRSHWGGHVERLIGTMMGECRVLPGATYNSPAARGNYDSKRSASLTIDELEQWMAHQILGRYHNSVHSALGVTPLEAWLQKTADKEPDYPDDIETFRLDLLPETTRTMSRYGISLFNQHYYSEDLGAALRAGQKASRVKYDPRDLSEIYVGVDGAYLTVPYRFADGDPPRTLWLYQAARRTVTESGRRLSSVNVRNATARAEALVLDAAKVSERAGRQAERLRLARRDVEAGRVGQPATSQADDEWDGIFGGDQ